LDSEDGAAQDLQNKKRRRLLAGLLVLAVLLISTGALFVRYLLNPEPLPDLLPLPVDVNYRPHYMFSIYGIERPVGVAVSPDGERIYTTEIGGEREVKAFDQDGRLLRSFSPPYTGPAERAPVYVAVGPTGRVFVADRLQRAVFVYDRDGEMLDAILGPDLTLSEYVSKHVDGFQPGDMLAYNLFGAVVRFQKAGEGEQVLPAPDLAGWAPLGIRVDERGTMLLTDVVEGQHAVREFSGDLILAATWQEFDPPEIVFGAQGHDSGEFMYPNSAVADSQGRIYVTDGNNGRISVWDELGSFLFNFGRGAGESALSLPRGAAMDHRDRLHIVDAVDQSVKVYDVSEPEPRFLFAFGDWGTEDGEFSYPVDIALDGTGRLYIADRENNRIQVWSY
jgi:sugar lactone lactonase YvrE